MQKIFCKSCHRLGPAICTFPDSTGSGKIPINKSKLVVAVADKTRIAVKDAESAVGAVFETIQITMGKGEDVRLVGCGTFGISHRAASKGRSPSTGAEIDLPARNVAKFTAGKGLKDAVNIR